MSRMSVTGLILMVAVVAAQDDVMLGYNKRSGECEGYEGGFFWHWTKEQCATQCNKDPFCSGFLAVEKGLTRYSNYAACRTHTFVCARKDAKFTDEPLVATYERIGFNSFNIPGRTYKSGECKDAVYKNTWPGQPNVKACAALCDQSECKHFVYRSDKRCQVSDNWCNGDNLINTDGTVYVFYPSKETGLNHAYSRTSWSSSLLAGTYSNVFAFDGIRYPLPVGGSCYITHAVHNTPWLLVDLAKFRLVSKIVLTNRDDESQDELNFLDIGVLIGQPNMWTKNFYTENDICGKIDQPFRGQKTIDCGEPLAGRFAFIFARDLGYKRKFGLCEMEVYSEPRDSLSDYELVEKTYCNYGPGTFIPTHNSAKDFDQCAILCNSDPRCAGFHGHVNGGCYFLSFVCDVDVRTVNTGWDLYIRKRHAGVSVPGYTMNYGPCTDAGFVHIKVYTGQTAPSCGAKCANINRCKSFNYNFANAYCYIYDKLCTKFNSRKQWDFFYNQGERNAALLGDAMQISQYAARTASLASDGILSQDVALGTCSQTMPDQITWWAVDLRFNTKVSGLQIYNRKDCCQDNLRSFNVYVTSTAPFPGQQFAGMKEELCLSRKEPVADVKLQCTSVISGRYVVVKRTLTESQSLVLCEVAVFGEKDYDVHGYKRTSDQPTDCVQNTVKFFGTEQLTPAQCGDECNTDKNCASFLYRDVEDNPQCWLKAIHCTRVNARPDPAYIYYDKIGHPGLGVAGYVTESRYFSGYDITPWGALDPSQCAQKCEATPDCVAFRVTWQSAPTCNTLKQWPDSTRWIDHDFYFTVIKEESNVAINRATSASASFDGSAGYAVDGCVSPYVLHHSCARIQPAAGRSWWSVDLEKATYVYGVKILNDADDAVPDMNSLVVVVSDNTPFVAYDPTEVCYRQIADDQVRPGEYLTAACEFPIVGRYVIIVKESDEPMTFCEVLVKGELSTDENVALEKQTDQVSTEGTGIAAKAVDGRYNSHLGLDTCAQTMVDYENRTTWWSVDLGNIHSISAIKIRNRGDCCGGELRKITLSVSMDKPDWNYEPHASDVCNYHDGSLPFNATWSFRCREPAVGRFVVISKNIPSSDLVLCEVEVFGRLVAPKCSLLDSQPTCEARQKKNECTTNKSWMSTYCKKSCLCPEAQPPVGYWPLIASYKARDVRPGKSHGELSDPRIVKSIVGPLLQPYTAFEILKTSDSNIVITSTEALNVGKEFTVGLYVYQTGFVDDSTVLEWSGGGVKLTIYGKQVTAVMCPTDGTSRVIATSSLLLEPNTWYYMGLSADLNRGLLSVFANTKYNTEEFVLSKKITPLISKDILLGGSNFGGRVSCLQLFATYMELVEVLAARASCKSYLKTPGDTAVNIAKGKPASQSTTLMDADAGRATDGSDAPYFWRNSCTATVQGPAGMDGPHWWTVDLQELRSITSVKIANRIGGNPERLSDFRVLVTTTQPRTPLAFDATDVCAYHKEAFKGGQSKILTCARELPGRYVTVTKTDPSQLTLCEVEVYGDLVLPQPAAKDESLFWRCINTDYVRRVDNMVIYKEISNIRLCYRACLLETTFVCKAIEYERSLRWCRLYSQCRDTVATDMTSLQAALTGTIEEKSNEQSAITATVRRESQRKDQIRRLGATIDEKERQKAELESMGELATNDTKLKIDELLEEDKKLLAALLRGTVREAGAEVDKEQELFFKPQSEYQYCFYEFTSKQTGAPECPLSSTKKKTEKEWSGSENWVLNFLPNARYTEVLVASDCHRMCDQERGFVCLSYAYNNELKTCSLWTVNAAAPGVELVPKKNYVYHQWQCIEQLTPCVCWIGGDPHYKSFDSFTFDNQGTCKYMTAMYDNTNDMCKFYTEHKNQHRTGPSVSWIQVMDLKIHGHTIRLTHGGQIWYDGMMVTDIADANSRDPRVQIEQIGKRNRITATACGILMEYDGYYNFMLTISRRRYGGKIGGLCGNCDGNRNNDQTKRIHADPARAKADGASWINSWEVFDDSGLTQVCKRVAETTPCEGEWNTKVRTKDYCGYILDLAGPFASCLKSGKIDYNQLYKECVYDVCSFMHNPDQAKEMACGGVERLVDQCASLSLPFNAWRTPEFCPMECGRNMEYSPRMSGCPNTCADPEASKTCNLPDSEGCHCQSGYILNDRGSCIVAELCAPKSLADIAFCLDQSDTMGSKMAAAARDFVACTVDTFHISETTTQVSVLPYSLEPSNVILYSSHGSRAELVEAIRNLPFLKGSSNLQKCVQYVRENIFTEELAKKRPEDHFLRVLVIVTSTNVADDDSVTENTKQIYARGGKVVWIKYDSETAPPAGDLTIPEFIFPVAGDKGCDGRLVEETTLFVYKESKCGSGFYNRRYTDYETCEDIDECRLELCTAGSTCQNTIGSYKCQCPEGFCFNPLTGCEEINECYRNPCLPGSTCNNTIGSYTCMCPGGYTYDLKRSCVDIDECLEQENVCVGKSTKCNNKPGSYECTCPDDQTYIDDFGCSTENQCKTSVRCKTNAICTPRKDGFECVCPDGMYHDERLGCLLKMPCGDNPCRGELATCVQHAGTFQCLCPNMNVYKQDEGCEPIDPCLAQPCKGRALCTTRGTEFYCGCERGLYYNPEVGCEEPQTRLPTIKIVMILDDSNKVGQRQFVYVKDAAKNIAKTLAGKSETLNMGVWLSGGRPEMVLTQAVRAVEDYAEHISDIEYTGGAYSFSDAVKLVLENEELTKKDMTSQIIVVVITGNNVDHTSILKPACSKLGQVSGSECKHVVILFGYDTVVDTDSSYYILLQNAVELYVVHESLGESSASWMKCPAGFVRTGDKCRIESSVLYKCKDATGEVYAADAIWTEDCITYKCVRNGATPIKAECRDATGKCQPATGAYYPCVLKGQLRKNCRCSVEIVNGEAKRNITYVELAREKQEDILTQGGTADGAKCHFPFYYQGELIWECCTKKSSTPWCATTDNFDIDNKWGYCKPGVGAKVCDYGGKSFYEGQFWWVDCARFKCTDVGVQVQYPKCKSKGATKCVDYGAEDFPCEINGKNYDACVCAGSKNKAELFAISSRETVEEAYGGGNPEAFCTMGNKEYAIGEKWEIDCSEFICAERKTADGGEVIGCTVEALRVGCKVQKTANEWICLNVGQREDACGSTTEGEARSCSCSDEEEGLMITYKTATSSYSISAATSSYSASYSSSGSGSSSSSSE